MRYIRTKDGKIYDTEKYAYTWSTITKIGLGISQNESVLIPKSLIERQVDSIAELCDCLVYKRNHLPQIFLVSPVEVTKDKSWVETIVRDMTRNGVKYWGSIWVGEDLIKVANVDEKGDFELL